MTEKNRKEENEPFRRVFTVLNRLVETNGLEEATLEQQWESLSCSKCGLHL